MQSSQINKYALITGASGDIGIAIALEMARLGNNLILLSRSVDKLYNAQQAILDKYPNHNIFLYSCDVANSKSVNDTLRIIKDKFNTIKVLINCAGISGGGVTAEISDDLWNNVINTNLTGTFFIIRDSLKYNLLCEGSRIINIASTGGKQGVMYGLPYCASKHGVIGITKSLGLELAKNKSGITVNAVCPGFVESDMAQAVRQHYSKIWGVDEKTVKARIEDRVPLGRYIQPQEVAAMVAYLSSNDASGVTAQALNVCGGLGNY